MSRCMGIDKEALYALNAVTNMNGGVHDKFLYS